MINHGISTGALFLIVGLIYERRHTRMISDFGGLSKQLPVYATIFMIMTMSSIGLPALNGFIGEFTILAGAFQLPNKVWAVCGVAGIVLGAAYMLWLYQRTMFGKLDKPENMNLRDLDFREILTLAPLVALAFWIGLYPRPMFQILDQPVQKLVEQVNGRYYPTAAVAAGGSLASPAAPASGAAHAGGAPAAAGGSR
jgi:NADH-quinone oxidoreductase subunit M